MPQPFKDIMRELSDRFPSLSLVGQLGGKDGVWVLEFGDVRTAIAAAKQTVGMPGVEHAFVDNGRVQDRAAAIERLRGALEARRAHLLRRTAPGIQPVPENEVEPQGSLDDLRGEQWHFENVSPDYFGRDNNITESVYDDGIDGSGVTVGIVRQPPPAGQAVTTGFFERDHPDLTANFDENLSDPVDLDLEDAPRRSLTAQVGLVAAERDNADPPNHGGFGHGVAPGATFVTLNQGAPTFIAEMFEKGLDTIDIKVIPSGAQMSVLSDQFNSEEFNNFVGKSFDNAISLGPWRERQHLCLLERLQWELARGRPDQSGRSPRCHSGRQSRRDAREPEDPARDRSR